MSQVVTRVDIPDRCKLVCFKFDFIWLMKSNFSKINRISTQTNLMAFGLCNIHPGHFDTGNLVAIELNAQTSFQTKTIALYTHQPNYISFGVP